MDDKPRLNKEEYKPKPQLVSVRLLKSTGAAALVEWETTPVKSTGGTGKLNRATVQAADYVDGCVEAAALATSIPYGVAWEEVKFNTPKPADIAGALRQAGIWTKQDLFAKPQAAIGALQSVYRLDLGALIEFAQAAENKE